MLQKTPLFALLFFLIVGFTCCQTNNEIVKETDGKLNQNIEKLSIFNSDSIWKQNYYVSLNQFRNQEMSSFLGFEEFYGASESFVGNYEKSRYLFDSISMMRNFGGYPFDAAIDFFQPQNALETIISETKNKNLVLINEVHHRPEHRVFTTQLLQELYKQGFRYLAVEGMNERDSLINERKYPNDKSGFYIQEICYGNMLRTAMDLGFTIVTYDTYFGGTNNERDSVQAVNIYNQTFGKIENAKVLVHVGYGHLSKNPFGGNRPMGFMLSHLYSLSPFVINQVEVVEHEMKTEQSANYQHLINKYEIDKPIVLKRNDNEYWAVASSYDIDVIHPKLQFKNGRATFLLYNNRRAVDLPKALKQEKYLGHLIRVFNHSEPNSAVPIDQFELYDLDMKIIIPKGKYRIEIYNWNNDVVNIFKDFRLLGDDH
jgi:hypothetical protein